MATYPGYVISTPVIFDNAATSSIDFGGDSGPAPGPAPGNPATIYNFVGNTVGDIFYCSNGTSGLVSALAIGTVGQVLTVAGGVPTWATPGGVTVARFAAAKNATAQVIASSTSGSWTPITGWDDSTAPFGFDITANFVAATGIFTAPTAATSYFQFETQVQWADGGAGATNIGSRGIRLLRSTAGTMMTVLGIQRRQPFANASYANYSYLTAVSQLGASDTVVVQVTQDSNQNQNVVQGTDLVGTTFSGLQLLT